MATGYGVEMWCLDSIRVGKLATGVNAAVQALYRRTRTPRGTLRGLGDEGDEGGDEDELAYGFDVAGYVGAVGSDAAIRSIPVQLQGEFGKDDRVTDVVVRAAFAVDGEDYSITIDTDAVLVDTGESFSFTLGASDTTVTLLGVST